MVKRSVAAVTVAALLTAGVHAGEIKTHTWPVQFVFLEISAIPVVMDVGYFIRIKDQDKLRIKLIQDELDIHKFKGCVDMVVESNFDLVLSASINKTGARVDMLHRWGKACVRKRKHGTQRGGRSVACSLVAPEGSMG